MGVESLFPSYLFAYFSLDEAFYVVRHMPGVACAFGTLKDGPIVVDEQIVSNLYGRSQGGYIEAPFTHLSRRKVANIGRSFSGVRACFSRH